MKKVIYFKNDDQKNDCCKNQTYLSFLTYAFEKTNYFMLVYVNYYGKGYTKIMKRYREALKPFEIKVRTNPSWPGTMSRCSDTTYKVVFYKNNDKAKEILSSVECMSQWSGPNYPQDLAFFKGNQCWFYSVGHETIAAILYATEEDVEFVEKNGLADKSSVLIVEDTYLEEYNEILER